ncbi:MAG: hypothetical protein JO296_09255 [Pseudonocardiales bacterium]|nr:hypothetical protein [Pseudonocardiales bacterium]MBV9650313.1 hypothetical protein [Pseudonocardiales bacterium]
MQTAVKPGPKTAVCIQTAVARRRLTSSLIEEVLGVLHAQVVAHGDGKDQHQRQREP